MNGNTYQGQESPTHSSTNGGERDQLQQYIEGKRWEELINTLTKKDFRTMRENNARGWALLETGRYNQAALDFREVIQRGRKKNLSHDSQSYKVQIRASYRYCIALLKLGKYEEVIQHCDIMEKNLKQIDQTKCEQFGKIKRDAKARIFYRDQTPENKQAILKQVHALVEKFKMEGLKKRHYYLISVEWLTKWNEWIKQIEGEQEVTYPGPVDNSSLLRKISDLGYLFLRNPSQTEDYTNVLLRPQIREETDFIYVSEETYKFFNQKYGVQQEIKRHAMEDDDDDSIFVDLHLRLVRFMMFPINPIHQDVFTKFVVNISRKESINALRMRIVEIFKVYQPKYESFQFSIWKLDGREAQDSLIQKVTRLMHSPQQRSRIFMTNQKIKIQGRILDTRLLIDESQILPDDTLFIEVKEQKIKSIFQSKSAQTRRVLPSSELHVQNGIQNEETKTQNKFIDFSYMSVDLTKHFNHYSGKNGLKNIGNTCFLGSALQCLSSTQPLTRYFLTKQFAKTLNKNNKLGTGGHLAIAYYNLLIQLWTSRGSTAPWDVKKEVARKARQFVGYNQQDSSQFLNFLIDTLHQDLNLVKTKPYIEYKDSDGRPDDVVSRQYWNNFLSRNKSIMVELLYGQLKSKLRCLVCNRISNTFDPFAILSLPIPINLTIQFSYITKKHEFIKINACITDRTSFFQLAQQFINKEKLLSVGDPSHIMAVAVDNGKILKIFEIDNQIYGQRQLLNRAQLMYYDVGVPYGQLVEEKGFQIIEIRTFVSGSSKSNATFPRLLILNPAQHSVQDLKVLVFNSSLIYIDENQISTQQSSTPTTQLGNAQQHKITYNQVFNQETGESLLPDFYQLGIAQTAKKNQGFWNKSYQCELTGQKVTDLQLGLQLNSITPRTKLDQLIYSIKKKVTKTKRLIINSVWSQKSKVIRARIAHYHQIANSYDLKKKSSSGKSEITLQQCLSAFRGEEVLDGQDKWYCSRCKEHQRANKKMDLFKLPQTLIIQLKRFKQKGRASYFWGPTCEKNSKFISFPIENLDLSEYILQGSPHYGKKEDTLYDLNGVVHHMGSLYGGHYIATAKNFIDNQWYQYDDSHVSQCRGKSEIVASSAYVLFYKRKNRKFD